MAFLSNILSVAQPTGAWISIIKAFESGVGNYILAIILLTVVIKVIWSVFDTVNKYSTQKMTAIQSQMQPEMEKLEAKYAKQPQVLQQKKNELQQRYMGKSQMGSCFITLIIMALNMVIFFTLFSGLNTMASYKIASNYDNLKYTYANCLNVADKYLGDEISAQEKLVFADYENLKFVITGEGDEKTISLVQMVGEDENVLATELFKYEADFTSKVTVPPAEEGGEATEKEVTNQNIIALIQKYIPVYEEGEDFGSKEVVVGTKTVKNEEGQDEQKDLYLSEALQNVAMRSIVAEYDANQESFLWIKNIWIADSPFEKSVNSYNSVKSSLGKSFEEGEDVIYASFMDDLKEERSQTNGYYILPILCVLVAIGTMAVTNLYNRHKNKKKGLPPMKKNAKWTQFIVPAILGIFALFYNSVFAIYLLTSQIVSTIVLPLQLFIIDKILDKKEQKKVEQSKPTVDYSRKF